MGGRSAVETHGAMWHQLPFHFVIITRFLAEQSPQRCYSTCELDTTRLSRAVVWATPYLNTRHHRGLVGDELVCVRACL